MNKQKYYVRCGEIERWVMAFDHYNAAVIAYEEADPFTVIDTNYFYVSKDYIPDIEFEMANAIVNSEAVPARLIPFDDVDALFTEEEE